MDRNKASKDFIVFLLLAVSVCAASEKVQAAWRYNKDIVYLAGENNIMQLRKNVSSLLELHNLLLTKDMHVRAAYYTSQKSKVLFYTNTNGFLMNFKLGEEKPFKYGPKRAFIKNGDVDAAARKGDKVYFFKGCQMAIRHKWYKWGKPKDMRTVGLPCHVDAAWKQGNNGMALLRGDQVWFWLADDSVVGPQPFNSLYTNTDWVLAPYSGDDKN